MEPLKQQIISNFDPSQPGVDGDNLYGLPFSAEYSDIIVIPVPWEVTVSYGSGASAGPEAILESSFQVDLHHQEYPDLWKLGLFLDFDTQVIEWQKKSAKYRELSVDIIEALELGKDVASNKKLAGSLEKINEACRKLHDEVRNKTTAWLNKGKLVALVGGDHSTPLGYYEALAANHNFGILHLDAHMDLRIAYEGFTFSHASIMYNALKLQQIEKIVQVGIRDFCKEEVEVAQSAKSRVKVFTDADLKKQQFEGLNWQEQCDEIIAHLPEKVVISFDIDALHAWYCPNTGTPVPGGLSFEQAAYLISRLGESKRQIIGFDLVEVAPGNDDWDGNVGARMLYHLSGVMAKNNGKDTGSPIVFK